ncbi:acetyltransferase [Zooshikella harenae]|uniref:Acetyltransferase n=1 Tax=Zooshikella harenae TaxID=2827238 RepID=A0ABS5ZKL2_9GAMM|nr:acetyltransferase [Zooshikella harenae]MBU2713821.1 acetyltransferase [Zooshikella harenae]
MEITTPSQKDYSELVSVWESSVRATHDFLTEQDILFYKPMLADQFFPQVILKCIKNTDNQILGFIGTAENNIEMLFIDPDYRGKGVGKKLLTYALHELGTTKVDVNEQNDQAVGFYKHLGFKVIGRSEKDGMGKPFPLLHMEVSYA